MTTPLISLNGTTANELINALCDANCALSDALVALSKTCPNGRDYSGNDFKAANAEHAARMDKLCAVKREIETLAEMINEAA